MFYCKGDYSTEPVDPEPEEVVVEVPTILSINVIVGIIFGVIFFCIAFGTIIVVLMFAIKLKKYKKVMLSKNPRSKS